MKEVITVIVIIYLIIANIVAIALTIKDKRAARRHQLRVPERVLFIAAALSGCVGMYVTMRIIHHKTKHPEFMIGIPAIFVAEILLVFVGFMLAKG